MITLCKDNKQELSGNLSFGETLKSKTFGKTTLVLQLYYDEEDQLIYNISFENKKEQDFLSVTTDMFETKVFKEAEDVFDALVNLIKNFN